MKNVPWIVVSGLDGSGKTTLVSNLENWFTQNGLNVKRARLPYDRYLVKNLLNVSKDTYTDRLLFALDNRLFAEHLKEWRSSDDFDVILTQRGFLDSFVHAAVQGYDYSWTAKINKICDLHKCDIIIHMVAKAETAYQRIKDDPNADKFENIEYIRNQETETIRAYAEIQNGNPALEFFKDSKHIFVDTTNMTTDETFEFVKERLQLLL